MTKIKAPPVRATKMWWYSDKSKPVHVKGYECRGTDYWWIPEVGFSVTEGKLRATESEANARARFDIQDEVFRLNILLESIE